MQLFAIFQQHLKISVDLSDEHIQEFEAIKKRQQEIRELDVKDEISGDEMTLLIAQQGKSIKRLGWLLYVYYDAE